MRMVSIQRIDGKGRVSIPARVRGVLGLREGMMVLLVADIDERRITLSPFTDPEAKLAEFTITFEDVPGALARAASVLAGEGIDLLFSESRTLRRGELAEWVAIADYSKCLKTLEEIRVKLISESGVKAVKIRRLG